jgi:hypothetical protein
MRARSLRKRARHTERLVDRKPLGVQGDLRKNLTLRIQAESIKKEKGVNQDVGRLIRDTRDIELTGVVPIVSPLEKLKEFPSLNANGYCEILGRMKLRPVSLVAKSPESFKKLVHRNLQFGHPAATYSPSDI